MGCSRLPAGTRLGPYEIGEIIGSGGMGEVYRGRDTRLGRSVAIKVLAPSPADPDAVPRFRQEAQAASALNHPNIVTVYDAGTSDELPYLVTELLEGETVREAIEQRRLTAQQVLHLGAQAAAGLAAAHTKGILHRDIKPENLFITSAGVLKILDFGLSKPTRAGSSIEPPHSSITAPGVLLGTTGYLSPEQIRQSTVDHRTDIFSLGVVLYEALTGRQPFRGGSTAETLSAILTEDPPPVSRVRLGLTAAIDEVVRACLEKDSARRFDSAADLAFTLRALEPLAAAESRPWWKRLPAMRVAAAAAMLLLVLSAVVAAVALTASRAVPQPTYRRATFTRATISAARFKPGSSEIVYDAMIGGQPRELFATVPGTAEARPLGIRGAELLAISPTGDMALSLNRRLVRGFVGTGTLATLTEGRAPREVSEDVHWADWTPDGKSLAIVREVNGRTRLEFPLNTVLFETSGWISDPRFSPDGGRIAFVEHPLNADDRGRVMVAQLGGSPRQLSGDWVSILGLAWNASGGELWFTAQEAVGSHALRAVDMAGRQRVVTHAPGRLRLLDISRDGRVLLARDDLRLEAYGFRRGDVEERNLSWLDWSLTRDISADGTRLLLTEFGEAAGETASIYMRGMDGSPAARLATGSGLALSPDGRRVLSLWNRRLSLLPVGAGESTLLPNHAIASYTPWAGFFPDGRRIVFTGAEPGRAMRVYRQDLAGGRPVPITGEGFRLASSAAVSPDGDTVVVVGEDERLFLCPVSGGAPQPIPDARPGEALARWAPGGDAVYVFETTQLPARVSRLALDGRREVMKTLTPDELAGAIAIHRVVMTARGEAYAYTLERQFSDVYVATGLPAPSLAERVPLLGGLWR